MRLAEHENEGHNEELIALIVADMQDPVTPILEVAFVSEGLHDAGRMIPRFGEVVHQSATMVDEYLLRVGAVEIYLRHVEPPSNEAGGRERSACCCSRRRGKKTGSGDALTIWSQ